MILPIVFAVALFAVAIIAIASLKSLSSDLEKADDCDICTAVRKLTPEQVAKWKNEFRCSGCTAQTDTEN